MKWESSDLTVGAVVLTAVLILAGGFLWLSPAISTTSYPLYTEFDRIDGIARQANVVLRGYNVGSVADIQPRMDADGLRFRVRLNIHARVAGDSLLLPVGTTARLVPPPVIGAGFIVLEPPRATGLYLEPGASIPGVRTEAIVEQMQGLTTDMSGEVLSTMVLAQSLMDSVAHAMGFANQALAHTTAALPRLLASMERQLELTESLTRDVQGQLAALAPVSLATIDSVNLLMSDSRALVQELHGTLATTMPDVQDIIAHLDTTTVLFTHFVREVTARPWRMFTGVKPPPGLTPPPPAPAITAGNEADTVPRLDGPRPR